MMFECDSTLPSPVGKTRSASPFGHASFHSRSVFSTMGVKRNRPLAGFRLRLADRAVAVRALANVKLALIKIDVLPSGGREVPKPEGR